MGFGIIAALLTGCNDSSSGSGSSSTEPSASVDELKLNPTDVDSELRSKGKNPTEVRSYSTGGNGMNLFGYPVLDGCGYNTLTDQYVCTDDNYVRREYQNLGITAGDYTINTVTMEEDVYNVDHYSPLRIVNDPYYHEPSRGWWPSSSDDNGYDYVPVETPTTKPWNGGSRSTGGSGSDNYDNGGSTQDNNSSGWPSSSGSTQDNNSSGWPSSSGSTQDNSSGWPSSTGGTEDNSSGWPSSSGSTEDNGSSTSGSGSDNYDGNIFGVFSALTSQAEAMPSRTIVYDQTGRYYTIGAQHYVYQPTYTVPYIIQLGYTKDWLDYMSDYDVSQSSLHIYYTKGGQSRDVAITVNGPLNSPQRAWVKGSHSGTTSDVETLSKILQGTYVPPAPPAPPVPVVTTPATTTGSGSDNYDGAPATPSAASTTTTVTTTTTVEKK